ncbi:hypothetical protein Taro_018482 [Colocasia esculenta]|uniref:Uncharacterized protein n=1 Tax=Colocasia esculenta TaxID=4460 RepID=A0A843UTX4_COLES|nr:hypothetical protein [Colocasia esculenta]
MSRDDTRLWHRGLPGVRSCGWWWLQATLGPPPPPAQARPTLGSRVLGKTTPPRQSPARVLNGWGQRWGCEEPVRKLPPMCNVCA